MKKINFLTSKDLMNKKSDELSKYITEMQQNLRDLTHQVATNKEKKTHNFKKIKRTIAQAKTAQTITQGKEK